MDGTKPDQSELREAYAKRPFGILNVKRFVKPPHELASCQTTRSAFIFPVSGRARLTLGDVTFTGARGTVLHAYPGQPLTFEVLGERPFEHVNVYYEAGEQSSDPQTSWMDRPWAFSPESYDLILSRVEALEALGNEPSFENRLNQIIGATGLLKGMFETSPHLRSNEQMARVRSYIEAHCAEPLTLGGLAQMMGMTEQRLAYRFNKAYGVRPINYLIECRLRRAHELLCSGARVKEAAAAVGYSDPLYFSRLYKKHYGVAPTAAKKAAREVEDPGEAADAR